MEHLGNTEAIPPGLQGFRIRVTVRREAGEE